MGTKIQSNAFLQNHYPVTHDCEGSTKDINGGSLYPENNIDKNGHNRDLFAISPVHQHGYDMEKMRNLILEQDSTFRNQLQELHRLYRRQRELMNEIPGKETDPSSLKDEKAHTSCLFIPPKDVNGSWLFAPLSSNIEPRPSNSHIVPKQTFDGASGLNNLQFKRAEEDQGFSGVNNQMNGFTRTKDLFKSSFSRFNGVKEHLSNDCAGKRKFGEQRSSIGGLFSGKSMMFPQLEPRTEVSKKPIETGSSSVSQRKKKLFGVEIFYGNDDVCLLDQKVGHFKEHNSWSANSSIQSFVLGGNSKKDSDHSDKYRHENEKGGLPWFLRDSQHRTDPSNGAKITYFMNLDSLQNRSPNFFKKSEITGNNNNNNSCNTKKILGFPIFDVKESFKDLGSEETPSKINDDDSGKKVKVDQKGILRKGLDTDASNMRQYIDLNLSLDEQTDLSMPCEIDLEASAIMHSKANASFREGRSGNEETDKTAADALIAMASYTEENTNTIEDNNDREPLESASIDCLKWFADLVSSSGYSDDAEKESIPKDMDYFEYMTLNLEDAKEKNYFYNPTLSSLHKPNACDEMETITAPSKRSRRRGSRLRKDFQRDILPSLVTLSRLEVTEDFQAFEELNKTEDISSSSSITESGGSQKNCTRNSKVRKALRSVQTQKSSAVQQVAGQRSLTSWGRRTRRLPRQRCSSGILSFAVKC